MSATDTLTSGAQAAPSTPAPAPAAADAGTQEVQAGGLSPEQIRTMFEWEVQAGRLTRTQADELIKAEGVEPKAQPSAEQAEWSKQNPRAQSPNDYEMPAFGSDDDSKTTLALEKLARGALFTAGFDRERGSALLKYANKAAEQTAGMSPAELEWHAKTEELKLQRIHGAQWPEKKALARQLIRKLSLRHPGVLDIFSHQGVGNDPMVFSLILSQAERLNSRPD